MSMTAEQEIRIRIIECITKHAALASFSDPDKLTSTATKVEKYVTGKRKPGPKPKQQSEQG